MQEEIHALLYGLPLCEFTRAVPKDWPDGHKWVPVTEQEQITCPECKKRAPIENETPA